MEIIVDDEYVIEHEQEKLHIVAEFEIINHNYKILIVTLTIDRYTKYLFKVTKYEDNICISEFDIYTTNTDLSKEINDICIDYSNIECNVTIVHRDNAIYSIKFKPVHNNNNIQSLVFLSNLLEKKFKYIIKCIHDYLSKDLYLFDINNKYILK